MTGDPPEHRHPQCRPRSRGSNEHAEQQRHHKQPTHKPAQPRGTDAGEVTTSAFPHHRAAQMLHPIGGGRYRVVVGHHKRPRASQQSAAHRLSTPRHRAARQTPPTTLRHQPTWHRDGDGRDSDARRNADTRFAQAAWLPWVRTGPHAGAPRQASGSHVRRRPANRRLREKSAAGARRRRFVTASLRRRKRVPRAVRRFVLAATWHFG